LDLAQRAAALVAIAAPEHREELERAAAGLQRDGGEAIVNRR
jgi:acyl-CoA hydrolase